MVVEKAALRRNVFTIEGPGKGNRVACVTTGEREQDEVTKLKNINIDVDYYQSTE
jgi:hypothetical protein